MKKTIVKLLFIVFIISIMAGNLNSCYAREDETGTIPKSESSSTSSSGSSAEIDPNTYKPSEENPGSVYTTAVGKILGAIQLFGTVISVVVLAVLGLKYMIGSVEQKAEYKKDMLPYIIGAVLLFSGSNLAQFIYTTMRS